MSFIIVILIINDKAYATDYTIGKIIGKQKSNYEGVSNAVYRPFHPQLMQDLTEDHHDVIQSYKECTNYAKNVTAYTKQGYAIKPAPVDIVKYLQKICASMPRRKESQKDAPAKFFSGPPAYIIDIPDAKKQWITQQLKPIAEKWSGVKLKITTIYGAREYRKNSALRNHVDRDTHIISAIIHIDRKVCHGKNWGLTARLEGSNVTDVIYTQPGDMVLYESRRLHHGRPAILPDGTDNRCPCDEFINLFVHYQPEL